MQERMIGIFLMYTVVIQFVPLSLVSSFSTQSIPPGALRILQHRHDFQFQPYHSPILVCKAVQWKYKNNDPYSSYLYLSNKNWISDVKPTFGTEVNTSINSAQVQVPAKNFVSVPFEYHQELTLRVSSLTNLGMGICRTSTRTSSDDIATTQKRNIIPSSKNKKNGEKLNTADSNQSSIPNNWVIMVPNVIPGELVQLQIHRNHKTYSEANLIDILEPSPNRVNAKCPLFQKCGGCQYQHMDIITQRKWKQDQVQELLERVGGLDPSTFPSTLYTLGTDHIYHYRSKLTPDFLLPKNAKNTKSNANANHKRNKRKYHENDDGTMISIGFKEKSSRLIVDVPKCYIATHAINQKLTQVREHKQKQWREGKLRRPKRKGPALLLRDVDQGVVTDPSIYVETTVSVKDPIFKKEEEDDDNDDNDDNSFTSKEHDRRELRFRFMAGNFFQNNPYMLSVMVEQVIDASIQYSTSTGTKMTHLIDCYCGSGLFCLSTSKYFDQCVGIEVNSKAVEEACINAQLNDITNCDFVAASAEHIFECQIETTAVPPQPVQPDKSVDSREKGKKVQVQQFPRQTTVVVVDPPRKGCSDEFLSQLYEFAPQRVVYMSCDPATQARDARGLVQNGYNIVSVQPFDLFPQTRHIESLIVFEKVSFFNSDKNEII